MMTQTQRAQLRRQLLLHHGELAMLEYRCRIARDAWDRLRTEAAKRFANAMAGLADRLELLGDATGLVKRGVARQLELLVASAELEEEPGGVTCTTGIEGQNGPRYGPA